MMVALVLIMSLLGAFGAFFLKRASMSEGIRKLLSNRDFYLGGGLYLLSALLNIYILRYLPYTVVLPLTSITYVWTALIGWKLLGEKLTVRCLVGIWCIVAGVAVLVTS